MKQILNLTLKTAAKELLYWIVVVAVLATAIFVFSGCGGDDAAEMTHRAVARGDVEITIQASGVIMPIERREITAMVAGEVMFSPFEEGDTVRAGDVLYRIDSTDARINVDRMRAGIDRANVNIDRTQTAVDRARLNTSEIEENIAQLTVRAGATGILSGFNMEVGDQVNAGLVGTITDTDNLTVRIPFLASDVENIHVGSFATVTSGQFMVTISGTVINIFDSSAMGGMMRDVEISLINPGALETQMSVGATINGIASAGNGTLSPGTTAQLIAEQSGRVESVYARSGQLVFAGQVIAQLSNTALTNQRAANQLTIQEGNLSVQESGVVLRESNLNLQQQQRRLNDYTITSPIDGVVISKNRDVGDNIGAGGGMREILMVVADVSQMVFDIDVDEMEIARVEIGQDVIVTVDALPGQEFDGVVTNVAAEGVAANGVTKFAVEITIAEPGDLMPGMNADANIVVDVRSDVLTLPSAFVSGAGEHGVVIISGEQESPRDDGLPEGYRRLHIQVGLNNGRFVEILGGLREGDIVAMQALPSGGNTMMPMGPGMQGPGGGGGQMHVRQGGDGGQMVIRGQ